jgi:preprotein translocase subunit SecF
MNRLLILVLAAITLASCSSPKYTYNFDHYDYNAGRPKKVQAPELAAPVVEEKTIAEEPVLTASTSDEPVAIKSTVAKAKSNSSSPVSYKEMSRAEKKEFRQEVKKEFKRYVKAVRKGEKIDTIGQNRGESLDADVKLAIIFGAVGVVLFIVCGVSEIFTVLGAIALLVGVYFLIKWLIRQ